MALRIDNPHALPNRNPVQAGGPGALTKPSVTPTPSPNRDGRPGGLSDISAIVLHHTSGGTLESVSTYFQNERSDVSSHYVIGKDGRITQPVTDGMRAWHAGRSSFQGRDDVNDFSLGIEMVNEGDGRDPFTDAQYSSLVHLVAWMCQTYQIPMDRITGHKDVALPRGRKDDPAENFDWNRVRRDVTALLAGQGTSLSPATATASSARAPVAGDRVAVSRPSSPAPIATTGPSTSTATHVVRQGEFLTRIAQERLGDSSRWREIYELNRDRIQNPNLIFPGQTLRMPAATPVPSVPAPETGTPVRVGPVPQPVYSPTPQPVVQPHPQPVYPPSPQPVVQPQPGPRGPVIIPIPIPVRGGNPPAQPLPSNPAPVYPGPAPVQPSPRPNPAPSPRPVPGDGPSGEASGLRIGGAVINQFLGRDGFAGGASGGFMRRGIGSWADDAAMYGGGAFDGFAGGTMNGGWGGGSGFGGGGFGGGGARGIGGGFGHGGYGGGGFGGGGFGGGVGRFFGRIGDALGQVGSMVKQNFAIAAVVSAVSNTYDVVRGRVSAREGLAGFAVDTVAYTGIGTAATATGAAIGSILGPAGTVGGFLAGTAVSVLLGWLYEKNARTPMTRGLAARFNP